MNNTFITHPSVRIKSTENNYNPVQCFDPLCHDKSPHMHCPFCVKTESYTDPVILKAHYRVKHVDKGIDFAGLKVLRCCDQCDIVGVIKGEKKFKGAHWHCYKCKNGFNRRDEAIKHYKTHFRNPQTTFQIQIAQEVNQPVTQGYESEEATASLQTEEFSVQSIHPVLTEAITCMTTAEDQGAFPNTTSQTVFQRNLDGAVSMPGVGAIETVSVADTQTIMIIQEDGNISTLQETLQDVNSGQCGGGGGSVLEVAKSSDSEGSLGDLQQQVHILEKEKEEQQMQIEELKKKIDEKEEYIAAYKIREQELLDQLSLPLDKNIKGLCEQLELQHKELLQQQLNKLKRSFYQSNSQKLEVSVSNSPLASHLNQSIDLQSLTTDNGASNSVLSMNFRNTDSGTVTENEEQTHNSSDIIVIPIVGGEAGVKCGISPSPHVVEKEEFEILHQDFPDTLEEDRLQIEDETIPIENDGQEPPMKRRKGK